VAQRHRFCFAINTGGSLTLTSYILTVHLSVAFTINALLVTQFFKGNFLHEYWHTIGNPPPFVYLCFSSSGVVLPRDMHRIECNYPKSHT